MRIPLSRIIHQGPVLAALGRAAFSVAKQRFESGTRPPMPTPGPEYVALRPGPDPKLVADYLRWTGADRGAYRGLVPAHMFPQWSFPLISRTLDGIPYPLMKVLNGGCRIEFGTPLPLGAPLRSTARLERIDTREGKVILHQRISTRAEGADSDGVVAWLRAVVPIGEANRNRKKAPRATVPTGAREIGRWRLSPTDGLSFALLTGDFNPIHWVPPYARAAGFRQPILHGFATLARAIETMNRTLWATDPRRLKVIDARFTRPLPLPRRVGVYIQGDAVFVGDAPGGPAYLHATFETN